MLPLAFDNVHFDDALAADRDLTPRSLHEGVAKHLSLQLLEWPADEPSRGRVGYSRPRSGSPPSSRSRSGNLGVLRKHSRPRRYHSRPFQPSRSPKRSN